MLKHTILSFSLLAFVSLNAQGAVKTKTVSFKTEDGWKIAASWKAPSKNKPVAVLIHGVGSARGEWDAFSFTKKLHAMGWGTLAIDLRGHGESLEGPQGKADFKTFSSPAHWNNARKDLQAALAFLNQKKIETSRIGFIGASIGANLAGQEAYSQSAMRWVVLLSPGFNYYGVAPAQEYPGKKVILGASPQDSVAFQTVTQMTPHIHSHYFLQTARGHGVPMFEDPAFLGKLLELLKGLE